VIDKEVDSLCFTTINDNWAFLWGDDPLFPNTPPSVWSAMTYCDHCDKTVTLVQNQSRTDLEFIEYVKSIPTERLHYPNCAYFGINW